MITGPTMYQRKHHRDYSMDWERFMDRVIVLACLFAIVWMAMGWTQ